MKTKIALTALALLTACGGGGDEATNTASDPAPTSAGITATPVPAPSLASGSILKNIVVGNDNRALITTYSVTSGARYIIDIPSGPDL